MDGLTRLRNAAMVARTREMEVRDLLGFAATEPTAEKSVPEAEPAVAGGTDGEAAENPADA
jgi:hypothetical protein